MPSTELHLSLLVVESMTVRYPRDTIFFGEQFLRKRAVGARKKKGMKNM